MATLKETRTRISSVKNTRQVTSAMKMVSSAKLRKAQNILNTFLPFTIKQQELLSNLVRGVEKESLGEYFKETSVEKVLLIVVAGNRGLAGAFNSNVIKEAEQLISDYKLEGKAVDLLTIGKKAYQILCKGHNVILHSEDSYGEDTYPKVAKIANNVIDRFLNNEYQKVEFIYNHAVSAGSQRVMRESFLPISTSQGNGGNVDVEIDYIYEPNKNEIMEVLIPQILRAQFYKVILDSETAEHAARMIAMNKATDNAGELLKELNLQYNKARQSAITNEILEIVSGAEALNNG